MSAVIIVGASRGIGRALALAYAADGWQVVATVRRQADGAGLAGIHVTVADVTDEASLQALAHTAGPADLVIVAAGVLIAERDADAVDPAAFLDVMAVNALGPLLAARSLSGNLVRGGRFVALSSSMGSIGSHGGGGAYSYRMSKAALNMALTNLALEWRSRDIAVAALHPGWVRTAMGGSGASVEVAASVAGLRRVIGGLRGGGPARFLDYLGNRVDW